MIWITWRRTAYGWTAQAGGHRWTVRGPLFGQPMFWLYRDGSRVLEAGGCDYDTAGSYSTARAAKARAEAEVRRAVA